VGLISKIQKIWISKFKIQKKPIAFERQVLHN